MNTETNLPDNAPALADNVSALRVFVFALPDNAPALCVFVSAL
jgi:hypothetical protein